MKTPFTLASIVVFSALVLAAQFGFAQQATNQQPQQKYRINIVKDENGKQEVIDKTFDSKEELDAFTKENKIEAPEMDELAALPANGAGATGAGKGDNTKTKKIIIIESDAGNMDGSSTLQITGENLSAMERAQLIQGAINAKGENVQIEIRKERQMKWEGTPGTETGDINHPKVGLNEPMASVQNLSDVKVFPNPSTGQFHIEFNLDKATNVQLNLTDLNGKEIYNESFNNYTGKFEKNINSTNLSSGAYILNIQAGNEKRTTKVVMQ